MEIKQNYMTRNRCFTNNRNYKKQGIVIHSTATPGIMAWQWFTRWNRQDISKAVHAFVDDKEVIEYLPPLREAWHVATQKGNRYFYGIELCEDKGHSKEYFLKAYANDVKYTAKVVKDLGLSVKDIYSHKEANRLGFASNHGDPEHWWSKFGYNMDMFRRDVQKELSGQDGEIVSGGASDVNMSTGLKVDGYLGYNTIVALQKEMGTIQDGVISKKSMLVSRLQIALGVNADGILGPNTIKALQRHLGTYPDGVISKPSNMVKELQRRLNNGNLGLKVNTQPKPVPKPTYDLLVVDGYPGDKTIKRLEQYFKAKVHSSDIIKELQKKLNENQL